MTSTWPTHPDGTNKRVGDMTPEEGATVMAAAKARTAPDWWNPAPDAPAKAPEPVDFWQPA